MEHNSSRVLIVDDMPINRIILSSLLASAGVKSDSVETGHECIDLCSKKNYDLILLDHRMPDFDGVDTLVRLKEIFEEKKRAVPVICHTTEEGRKNINLYKAAGFADVLIKPIDPQHLSDILLNYLPERKYHKSTENTEEIRVKDELSRLPHWLKAIPKIDLVSGIQKCDTAEDYLDAIFVFTSSIETKASEIEAFFEKQNFPMFTLRVHSLKNIAVLIGLTSLAEAAEELENAGNADNLEKIYRDTPALLYEYRSFADLLAPILTDNTPLDSGSSENTDEYIKDPSYTNPAPNKEILPVKKKILLIEGSKGGIVNKGIYKHLQEHHFDVIGIADEPDVIMSHRFDCDVVLYYPGGADVAHIKLIISLLGELCHDDEKTFCLLGDSQDIEIAQSADGAQAITQVYPRPINMNSFVADMEKYVDRQAEYHRKKSIIIVDDDPDYLQIIEKWLSDRYTVHCFTSGEEVLDGLTAMIPDLILMDYEMPNMDGFDLMKLIKADPQTYKIPIIFLTGKNDRDHVIKILAHKPDGYLLKSSQKESLLDAINRFFSESILNPQNDDQ